MKTKNGIILKKIYLEEFIDVLIDIYDSGADYIDMICIPEGNQHMITLEVKEEYMFTEDREEEEEDNKLTDEELNQLI
jgi:hypothetical protein